MIQRPVQIVTSYISSDGQQWDTMERAQQHQDRLDLSEVLRKDELFCNHKMSLNIYNADFRAFLTRNENWIRSWMGWL
jgi:hypothetical protein